MIKICNSCWANIENNVRSVFWIDENNPCEDKHCEVYITRTGDDSAYEEKIGRAEERYTKLCIEQDEGGPVYD